MVVVVVMAVDVDVTKFITVCNASKETFKTATLLKTLTLNALITGEVGVGKRTIAQYILPNAPVIEASDFEGLLFAMESANEIIILDIDKSPNIKRVIESINLQNIRVIATTKNPTISDFLKDFFSIIFNIPSLSQRFDDVYPLIEKFTYEAQQIFSNTATIDLDGFTPDLTKNAKSLRKQVMINTLLKDIDDVELMEITENYLSKKLGLGSDYRDFLYLYEAPLIKAGLKRFSSQVQLADRLGLNRNTLRKKIAENKQYL